MNEQVEKQPASKRQACVQCHARKVKCDATEVGFPCSNCQNASRSDCRLHLKRKRASAKILRRGPVPFLPAGTSSTISPGGPASSPSLPKPVPKVEVASLLNVDTASIDGDHVFRRHLVEFIDQPRLTERPIDRYARTTYVGTDVSNLNFLVRQQYGAKVDDISHFPTNRISRRDICHEPDRLPVEAFQLPNKAVVDELLTAYFTHINPGFPVVDEDIFMRQYESKDPDNPPSLLLLHAILVVGAHLCFDTSNRESLKATFFRRAKSLFDARFERNRDTIVQAALLLTWHSDGPEDVVANAWYWLGIAARTATGMGMHRDAEKSTLVPNVKRMWRRVWWLLFQCDTMVSLQYGRPPSIDLADSDVQKLRPSDFQDCGSRARVPCVLQASELCVIISKALRERFRLRSTPASRQEVLRQTDESLANWALRLPTALQHNTGQNLDLWAANLQIVYNTALILLHRAKPYPSTSSASATTHNEDSDICKAAAGVCQALFQSLCERDEMKYLWSSSINCLFTTLIELSVEVRLSNPVLAISAMRRYDSALMSLREVAKYWPNAYSILHFFESSVKLRDVSTSGPAWAGVEVGTSDNGISAQHSHDTAANIAKLVEGTIGAQKSTPDREPANEATTVSKPTDQLIQSQEQSGSPTPVEDEISMGDVQEEFESWNSWRQIYWQQPESTDSSFLFTF